MDLYDSLTCSTYQIAEHRLCFANCDECDCTCSVDWTKCGVLLSCVETNGTGLICKRMGDE